MTKLEDVKHLNKDYDVPDPDAYTNYQREIYGSLAKPIFSTKPSDWESLARAKTPVGNFGYVFGSASSGKTHAANLEAFDHYRLRPKMLVNATKRDLHVDLFGQRLKSPLLIAPVGVQKIMDPQNAEEATARAAQKVEAPMIMSTAATRSIEQVATANGNGHRWYQLYWPKPQEDAITASILNRAKANGFKVLVVTLDTFTLAWRPEDLDNSYLPFIWGDGCQVGHSDPVFNERYQEKLANDTRSSAEKLREAFGLLGRSGTPWNALKILANAALLKKSQAWLDVLNSGTYREWSHLELLKKLWDGPIVLKGIQTVEDAHKAIEYGMDGIIISNHGGRQVNGAIASLDALAEIGADETVKESGIPLLFDSGIRTGSDVLKAIALGAKAVLIGRPFMYGLAIQGQAGVEHVLKCILADTDNTLANMGKTSLQELSREDLQIVRDTKL